MKRRLISQGTVSWFIGCHSIIHSILVVAAWKKLYAQWPGWDEALCILLHDIGHLGRDYLDDAEQKSMHWELGADLCGVLLGYWGYRMVAGHCPEYSKQPKSLLWKADKYAYVIAPTWWQCWNALVEPGLRGSQPILEHVRTFQKKVRMNYELGFPQNTHELHLELVKEREKNETQEA